MKNEGRQLRQAIILTLRISLVIEKNKKNWQCGNTFRNWKQVVHNVG